MKHRIKYKNIPSYSRFVYAVNGGPQRNEIQRASRALRTKFRTTKIIKFIAFSTFCLQIFLNYLAIMSQIGNLVSPLFTTLALILISLALLELVVSFGFSLLRVETHHFIGIVLFRVLC